MQHQDLVSEDYASKRTLRQPFQWDPLPDVEQNDTKVRPCRNSQQGKSLIVDEKGVFLHLILSSAVIISTVYTLWLMYLPF